MRAFAAVLRRLVKIFLAGLLALLPLLITGAVVMWVAGYVEALVGPGTMTGRALRKFGLHFVSDDLLAFVIGVVLVLGCIFLIGVAVESGARNLLQRLLDAALHRIPLVGSIYGTSKQIVSMLDRKDSDALKGMQVVLCYFGGNGGGAGFLALLVSPERYRIGERDYQIVIVPTAPVPIGGGLLFVPAEVVQRTDLSVDGLMSIYVSMGITAGQFLKVAPEPAAPDEKARLVKP
ncbi:MAG: DUF502 domain-containing protein [Pirellulaceae bacterium]|nr:DUF502 domain-containing protein [Pirellulaceae bacterium]